MAAKKANISTEAAVGRLQIIVDGVLGKLGSIFSRVDTQDKKLASLAEEVEGIKKSLPFDPKPFDEMDKKLEKLP